MMALRLVLLSMLMAATVVGAVTAIASVTAQNNPKGFYEAMAIVATVGLAWLVLLPLAYFVGNLGRT